MGTGDRLGFSGPEAALLVGLKYSTMDLWAREGLLRPSLATAAGSGTARQYSFGDLVALKVAVEIRRLGANRLDLRPVVAQLQAREFDEMLPDVAAFEAWRVSETTTPAVDADPLKALALQRAKAHAAANTEWLAVGPGGEPRIVPGFELALLWQEHAAWVVLNLTALVDALKWRVASIRHNAP